MIPQADFISLTNPSIFSEDCVLQSKPPYVLSILHKFATEETAKEYCQVSENQCIQIPGTRCVIILCGNARERLINTEYKPIFKDMAEWCETWLDLKG
jgi:hypothetical protein